MILWAACSLIVLTFRTSSHMEAAYGLSITVTMLMTTFLLYHYLLQSGTSRILAGLMLLFLVYWKASSLYPASPSSSMEVLWRWQWHC